MKAASIIVDGRRVPVQQARVVTWADDASVLELGENRSARRQRVRAIVLHTTWGRLGEFRSGSGSPAGRGYVAANARATNKSWDFTVDRDGTIFQQNDPARFFTWHAGAANPFSVGIEMVQALSGELYEVQVRAAVELIESLSAAFGLARLLPWRRGGPDLRVLPTVRAGRLDRLHGLFAHANFTDDRGPGDPGPIAFRVLQGAMGWVGIDWTADGPR
ncbi:MAG: peptidoglycan recognition family protein [Polyangiales bacterium]